MPIGRHSKARTADQQGLTRRRFLRAAGVGTAGAMAAAGAVMGQAGAEVAGAAVPAAAQRIPARRKVVRASGQQTAAAAAALAVSGPLSFHTITPQRYLDTRFDGGGAFPPQGSIGEFFIFDFGAPTTSPPASRTRSPRGDGDRLQPHRHRRDLRREPPCLPGQQRRDPAGLQRELDGRPDGGQLRHRAGSRPRPTASSRPPSAYTTPQREAAST
jgi:hypothetical protein